MKAVKGLAIDEAVLSELAARMRSLSGTTTGARAAAHRCRGCGGILRRGQLCARLQTMARKCRSRASRGLTGASVARIVQGETMRDAPPPRPHVRTGSEPMRHLAVTPPLLGRSGSHARQRDRLSPRGCAFRRELDEALFGQRLRHPDLRRPGVLSTIQSRFSEREATYWSSNLAIVGFDGREAGELPPLGLDMIRACSAPARCAPRTASRAASTT